MSYTNSKNSTEKTKFQNNETVQLIKESKFYSELMLVRNTKEKNWKENIAIFEFRKKRKNESKNN